MNKNFKKFEELTATEKKEICNGCGGKGSFITPPYAAFFKTNCDHHDYGYWKGGSEKDRKKCDRELYKAMKEDCERLPWFKRVRFKPWCWLYYRAVRQFGKKYFTYR